MRERGLAAIHTVCGQADDKADVVLMSGYVAASLTFRKTNGKEP